MISQFLERVQRKIHELHNRIAPRPVVLMYHRVVNAAVDPWDMCVSPRRFDDQMATLRKEGYKLLSLRDLIRDLTTKAVPRRGVVVTFDDGYADNLLHAKPILEKYNVPATVFITTGSICSEYDFWWDTLEQLLLYPGSLPATLHLEIDGRPHTWELNGAAKYSEQTFQKYRSWKTTSDPPTARHALFLELWNLLHLLSPEEKRRVLNDLADHSDQSLETRSEYRSLSEDELLILDNSDLIEIGAHTVNHLPLGKVQPSVQREEIRQSKTQLESLLNHPVTSFSYPHGSFTAETVATIRETGFSSACSSASGRIYPHTNPFHIPRTVIPNWTGMEFAERLKRLPT